MGEARLKQARADLSVGIGFPCGNTVPWQTTLSLVKTAHAATALGIPLNMHVVAGSSQVHTARDAVLEAFLKTDEKFLFWIDSDMEWVPQDFLKVLGLANKLGVACAAYPLKREPAECIINFAEDPPVANEWGCVEITGTGLGFTCVRRDILEAWAETKSKSYHAGKGDMLIDAFVLDTKLHSDGVRHRRGEDGAFFDDIRALGHKVWLDPTIELGHVGTKVYRVASMAAPTSE